MNSETVSIPLPFLTWQGLSVLLAALGVAVATGLVWLMLNAAARKRPPLVESWFKALAWVLLPVWFWLLGATLWGLWQVFNGVEGAALAESSFGLGALLAAGLGAPFVVYGTWLRHKTQRLEQEGHMTDRITAAVEQLGADKIVKRDGKDESVPNIEMRMGAILSLERIAQDSTANDKGRDHVRVMEILCAYIRENSNARKPVDHEFGEWEPLSETATETEYIEHVRKRLKRFGDPASGGGYVAHWAQSLPAPRPDIALALKVLGRRNAKQRMVEAAWPDPCSKNTARPFEAIDNTLPYDPDERAMTGIEYQEFDAKLSALGATRREYSGYRLDLRGANLQGADFSPQSLYSEAADFSGALFCNSRLEGANFSNTNLVGANFHFAILDGATMSYTRLDNAYMIDCSLEGASLSESYLAGAELIRANLNGAFLIDSALISASLWNAKIEGAWLGGALLEGANINGARLQGSDLLGVRTNSFTKTQGTDFTGSALKRLVVGDTRYSSEQIQSMFGDASAILPEGMERPSHWPDWELPFDDEHDFRTEWCKWQENPEAYRPPPKPET